jgi:hypothetical protein
MKTQATGALLEILTRDAAAGVDIFDDGGVPRPTPGPALRLEPLQRPVFSAPNWREEEAAAIRRDSASAAPTEDELAPPPAKSLDSRPAKPAGKSTTPRLDEVRRWLEKDR